MISKEEMINFDARLKDVKKKARDLNIFAVESFPAPTSSDRELSEMEACLDYISKTESTD